MPCWEVNLMTVAFKARNLGLLKTALDALGYSYREIDEGRVIKVGNWLTLDLENETAEFSASSQDRVNRVKQEYSWQAVQEAAKKKKWFIKKVQGSRKLQAVKH